jgi:hypothetical protein
MSDVLPAIDPISRCDVACPGESSHAEGSYGSSCLLMDGILALVLVIKRRRSIVHIGIDAALISSINRLAVDIFALLFRDVDEVDQS